MSNAPIDGYLRQEKLQFVDRLGDGKDGDVIQTDRPSAVKFLKTSELYQRELRMYRILHEQNIPQCNGFQLPRFIKSDDRFRAVEMTIVSAPYILDFASSYDDEELIYLGFTDDIWAEREQHWAEVFGEDWLLVREVRDHLAMLTGLMLLDLKPENIRVR